MPLWRDIVRSASATGYTNYIANPSFEADLTGWNNMTGGATISQSSTQVRRGSFSAKTVCAGSLAFEGIQNNTSKPLITPGNQYAVYLDLFIESGSPNLTVQIEQLNFGGVQVASQLFSGFASGSWLRVGTTITAVATAYSLRINTFQNGTAAGTFYIDGVFVSDDLSATDYFDRASTGPIIDWGTFVTPNFSTDPSGNGQSLIVTFNHNLGKASSNFLFVAQSVVGNDPVASHPSTLWVGLDEYVPVTTTQATIRISAIDTRAVIGAATVHYFAWGA